MSVKEIPPVEKISQRVQLPAEFITEAESDARRVGLSLPTLLGLAARRGWKPTLQSIICADPLDDAARAGLGLKPAASVPANRRKGGAN